MVQKFRKKPIEIEAYQITRELLEGVLFDDKTYPSGLRMTSCSYRKETREIVIWRGEITTSESREIKVVEGDWIITDSDGIHHYKCKPDFFTENYELI